MNEAKIEQINKIYHNAQEEMRVLLRKRQEIIHDNIVELENKKIAGILASLGVIK
jgi:hypothetical protein